MDPLNTEQELKPDSERRTTTDHVFESLREDIFSLAILPGAKMSEAEIAARFGVSRQPVRDAFNRLEHIDLVKIRPQKATVVRGFSIDGIAEARFLRMAVEMEVIRVACQVWDEDCTEKLMRVILMMQKALKNKTWDEYHAIDFQFHLMIAEVSGCEYAIKTIKDCRQITDRLCDLSFSREKEINTVDDEHLALLEALKNRDQATASEILRAHLLRLDSVVTEIQSSHPEYFE